MTATVLTILLVLFSAHSLIKFGFFFVLGYTRRRKALDKAYAGRTSATGRSDVFLVGTVLLLVCLLALNDGEPRSFLTGLLVGATLIQVYFHRFSVPLTPSEAPPEPVSPIKTMSYAIQADPARPWVEIVILAVLILASVVGLVRHGI
ncbi:MAG: hypothetical protein M3R41_00330 [Pseudomonadota bacterium]|nr:hypothetical protein [Pseudomonadota bacterium]